MGKDEWLSHNTIRVSLCEDNTPEEIQTFITALKTVLEEIRS